MLCDLSPGSRELMPVGTSGPTAFLPCKNPSCKAKKKQESTIKSSRIYRYGCVETVERTIFVIKKLFSERRQYVTRRWIVD
jgi:hypothetical protein